MTRPIEFRAWTMCDQEKYFMEYQNNRSLCEFFTYVNPENLMQFTGLLDLLGNKLFEGDIIVIAIESFSGSSYVNEVFISTCKFMDGAFYLEDIKDEFNVWLICDVSTEQDTKVIGNIFETPELLKNG